MISRAWTCHRSAGRAVRVRTPATVLMTTVFPRDVFYLLIFAARRRPRENGVKWPVFFNRTINPQSRRPITRYPKPAKIFKGGALWAEMFSEARLGALGDNAKLLIGSSALGTDPEARESNNAERFRSPLGKVVSLTPRCTFQSESFVVSPPELDRESENSASVFTHSRKKKHSVLYGPHGESPPKHS